MNWLNGGDAKPTFVPPRPFERGVDGRPTLVQNVETLCDLALIGRFGSDWYRTAGTMMIPATTLVTLSGAVKHPGVFEIPLGMRLGAIVAARRAGSARPLGDLVGGYFGAWSSRRRSATFPWRLIRPASRERSRCGSHLCDAAEGTCALAEVARVTRWLADQNAGQCGPCVNGLDSIAGAMRALVTGERDRRAQIAT